MAGRVRCGRCCIPSLPLRRSRRGFRCDSPPTARAAGWFSPFLLACFDPDTGEFQSVCRVMSGFTDAFYSATTAKYKEGLLIPAPKPYYRTGERPDVWFEPVEVGGRRRGGCDCRMPLRAARWYVAGVGDPGSGPDHKSGA